MALCNVACILARSNPKEKILMMDWDLEAPGLHRFFFNEKSLDINQNNESKITDNFTDSPGLIDLFLQLTKEVNKLHEGDDAELYKLLREVNLEEYLVPTVLDNLMMLKAGRIDEKYSDDVNSFSWQKLYEKAPSLIRLFAQVLTERYKYVLIDSRTGFTDIGGICTMLMPQKLVVVFTPNSQSYTGMKELIIKATTYRKQSEDLRPLLVYPLPSRIEFSRDDLRAQWRFGTAGIRGYQTLFEEIFKQVYGLRKCNLQEYFEEVQIQQSPNYAYGEEIAILTEKTRDSFSLSNSYEVFTKWLTDSIMPWQRLDDDIAIMKTFQVFISYAREDEKYALRLYNDLKNSGLPIEPWWDKSLMAGDNWRLQISENIKKSAFIVALFSSTSLKGGAYLSLNRETKLIAEILEESSPGTVVIPARLDECKLPYNFEEYQNVDLFPEWYDGLKSLLKSIQSHIDQINSQAKSQSFLH